MSVDDLAAGIGDWLRGTGPMSDVVVSSRIRLARNLAEHHFLHRASEDEKRRIFRELAEALTHAKLDADSILLDLEELCDLDRQFLVERHLISQQHAEGEGCRGVAVALTETRSLMINEEDHLRIQVLRSGLELEPLWDEISGIDDRISQQLTYAFDPKLGYLTACPTNLGTGLRVSVMMHLPALKLTGEIEKVLRAAKDLRLAVRGLYGEGTEAVGDFYQVSNQVTLGRKEEDIIEEFATRVIPRIVEYENAAREALNRERAVQLDDKIWRAYGILENARAMASDESMFFLSHVRMGVSMGRFKNIDMGTLNELLLQVQPAHLQKIRGSVLTGEERSVVRAEYLRRRLGSLN